MVTLAAIFRQHGPVYRRQFASRIPANHQQAMRAIAQCRTAALGGHVFTCPDCDYTEFQYHSCRNRHCPQCQGDKARQWLTRQQELLLPTPYFMLTFTLPSELRRLARSQQKLFYNLLFRASAAATQELAQDPRFLGGSIGMIGVLHTWSRTLAYHPHVHYLIPAGAWDGLIWRRCRYKRFLLPVKALSPIFRAKFRDALRKTDCFQDIPNAVWQKDWVVHCQPVGRGQRALKYLSAYLFRVAISNRRLVAVTDETVTFRYRPSGSRQWRLCTLSAMEFMRRFLQHVLPKGFVKVRYYGFFSPGQRSILQQIRHFFFPTPPPVRPQPADKADADTTTATPAPRHCPHCGQPLHLTNTIRPQSKSAQQNPSKPP